MAKTLFGLELQRIILEAEALGMLRMADKLRELPDAADVPETDYEALGYAETVSAEATELEMDLLTQTLGRGKCPACFAPLFIGAWRNDLIDDSEP